MSYNYGWKTDSSSASSNDDVKEQSKGKERSVDDMTRNEAVYRQPTDKYAHHNMYHCWECHVCGEENNFRLEENTERQNDGSLKTVKYRERQDDGTWKYWCKHCRHVLCQKPPTGSSSAGEGSASRQQNQGRQAAGASRKGEKRKPEFCQLKQPISLPLESY